MMTLIFIAIFLASIWLYFSPFYWKRKGVPHLWPMPIFGNSLPIFTSSLIEFYDKLYYTFPNEKLCGFHLLTKPVLLLRDPELIKDLFITDFEYLSGSGFSANYDRDPFGRSILFLHGEEWKEVRGKLSKYFTPYKLRSTLPEYVELSMKKLNKNIQQTILHKEPVEIDKLLVQLTTDIIFQALLGVETDSFTKDSYFNKIGEKIFSSLSNIKLLFSMISPKLTDKLNYDIYDKEVTDFLRKILIEVMDEREKKNLDKKDFVEDMMKLIEEYGQSTSSNPSETRYHPDGSRIPEYNFETIFAQILILISGGTESSATIMTFFLYEISINQEIQEKCRHEIMNVINETGSDIRYEDIRRLTYLEMAISETTRKYPAFTVTPRRCTKRYQFRNRDIVIDPGTILILPIRSIQWDPKYFPEPEKFLPERFSEENKASMRSGVNLAWGLGPRTCIGMNFAKLEMLLVLSKLLSKYRFTISSRTSVPLKLAKYTIVPIPERGLWLNVELLKELNI